MFASLVLVLALLHCQQVVPRVAIIELQGDQGTNVSKLLCESMQTFDLVDGDLTARAVRGAAYAGSLNLSLDDARSLGESIGCDFYLTGLARTIRRIGTGDETYFEGLAGIYLVETRSGRLVSFTMVRERGGTDVAATAAMLKSAQALTRELEESIRSSFKKAQEAARTAPEPEQLEVIDLEGGPPRGLTPPAFYDRLKPEYTADAMSIDLVATVEISAVFGSGGRVESSEVVRWAGFGLDQSALATVRKLRFKPATRQGKPLSVRGLVRYNFKQPPSAAEREAEANKLRESIRKNSVKP